MYIPDVSYTWHGGESERRLFEGSLVGLRAGAMRQSLVYIPDLESDV